MLACAGMVRDGVYTPLCSRVQLPIANEDHPRKPSLGILTKLFNGDPTKGTFWSLADLLRRFALVHLFGDAPGTQFRPRTGPRTTSWRVTAI